jgi:MOSC domain-containing protein YiiM/GNAT superfamily N-acetyltransferase
MPPTMGDPRLLQINVSPGGVPKLPVPEARVTRAGVEGDRQADATVHGGPHRAVSILGIEAIERVAAEGHPIAPGTTGENLTVSGFDVSTLAVGTRLAIGEEVVVELAWPANPCRTIRHSFSDLRFGRLGVVAHPADSRMYGRVLAEGTIRAGDPIRILPPAGDGADRFAIARRLDHAETESALAQWRAAADAGVGVAIAEDGDLAIAATPSVPVPTFNLGLGFAHLPNLVDRAVDHFTAHRVTGWVWTDAPPWPDAVAEGTAAWAAIPVSVDTRPAAPDGVVIRELGRQEVGPWASVVTVAAGMERPEAEAFTALEAGLARAAHHHRFVAEIDGTPVGAASLHVHRRVGWLRSGTVLPAYRGRGIQRALIEARLAHAARVGCDLAGASAGFDTSSLRNVERVGGRVVATRGRYRIAPDS